jgi:hypothetical protein
VSPAKHQNCGILEKRIGGTGIELLVKVSIRVKVSDSDDNQAFFQHFFNQF